MKHILFVALSIGIAMLGLSALLFGLSSAMAKAEKPDNPQTGIVVDTLDDDGLIDGDCSLREAIAAANTNQYVDACPAGDDVITDTITFDVAGTITVTNQLSVTAGGSLVIDGGSSITVSGNNRARVFYINTDTEITLRSLTVSDGYVKFAEENGGGIFNEGTLTLINSTLSDNRADHGSEAGICNFLGELTIINSTLSSNSTREDGYGLGGGIFNFGTLTIISSTLSGNSAYDGGGIYGASGMMTITSSSLSNNSVDDMGGGIYIGISGTLTIASSAFSGNGANLAGGGIYISHGTLTITNSTLSDNRADYGSGAGIANQYGTLTIINSTLTGNIADDYAAWGGGILNYLGTLTITSSTLSGNSAGSGYDTGWGGGIYNFSGKMTITNSTLWGNSAGSGGGIYNGMWSVNPPDAKLSSNIIAGSLSGGNCAADYPIKDAGYNLEDADTCGLDPAKYSMPNTDPLLGPLQDNGGSTWTHALLQGSPAIDTGDNGACPPIDQRGIPRPLDGNEDGQLICDIGSFELEKGVAIHPPDPLGSGAPGAMVEYTLRLYNFTTLTDTYTLALGTHNWETAPSTGLVGPLTPGFSQSFTATVTVPADALPYTSDTVLITATSFTSPTMYSATVQITTQVAVLTRLYLPMIIQNVSPGPEAIFWRVR